VRRSVRKETKTGRSIRQQTATTGWRETNPKCFRDGEWVQILHMTTGAIFNTAQGEGAKQCKKDLSKSAWVFLISGTHLLAG